MHAALWSGCFLIVSPLKLLLLKAMFSLWWHKKMVLWALHERCTVLPVSVSFCTLACFAPGLAHVAFCLADHTTEQIPWGPFTLLGSRLPSKHQQHWGDPAGQHQCLCDIPTTVRGSSFVHTTATAVAWVGGQWSFQSDRVCCRSLSSERGDHTRS